MNQNVLDKYVHAPEEYPVLMRQTHKVIKDKKIINERININENLMHYVQDTALLISKIDGSLDGGGGFDHIVYLDKSARPVSWLVNLFWKEFAAEDENGHIIKRPGHSYINIDRAPWFRNVGINVNDDGRQKDNGELATYADFVHNFGKLTERHLAEIRALFIEGGIEEESVETILRSPTILDGKRILIVDEVSRTGSTLNIAKHLFERTFPEAKEIQGAYFWYPTEPMLKVGNEIVLTSLPVWYDPNTLSGRGIGGLDPYYYRKKYEYYSKEMDQFPHVAIKKLRAHAFSCNVFSTPLLHEDGTVMSLSEEKVTRSLCNELKKMHRDYLNGRIFFNPPSEWRKKLRERYILALKKQGVKLIAEVDGKEAQESIRKDPMFYLNVIDYLANN